MYEDVNGKEHVLKTVEIEKMLTEEDKKTKNIEEIIKKGIIGEVVINRVMNDENIIRAEDCFITPEGQYCIVFEKMERTLEKRIEQERETGKPFPEWKIWVYFLQICRGVNYLNWMNIIHNDLQTENIMLDG